ncbi:MAG: DUF935 family protein [Opitutales bacterium]|nr:DUF935 family protein [Opitutales bacterium]
MKSEITDERILWEKRSRYNPLLGLSPQTLRAANDAFKVGYIANAARIWEEIEDADATLIAVRPKRRKRVSRLNWDIAPLKTASAETAKLHAQVLEDFYNNVSWTEACDRHQVGEFSRLVEAMLDCIGKKYSVHEIIWQPDAQARKLRATFKFVPLYFFENTTGSLRLLRSPNSIEGVALNPSKWLITATSNPLMVASSVCFLLKQMSVADWLVFSRRFGSALAWLKTDAPRGSKEWMEMTDMLANIDNESSFLTGTGEDLSLLQVSGQNAPFKEIIDHLSRLTITMWQGSDLATMSSQDGAGASLQGESADTLEDDDCKIIEETLSKTVSRFVIRYYFGDVEPVAYLQFQRTDREDKKKALEILGMTADRGVAVSQSAWREASGVAAPADGEPIIEKSQPAQPASAFGANSNEERDLDLYAEAINTPQKQKLFEELDRIDSLSGAERTEALIKLQQNLKNFFTDADAEAEAIAKILERRLKNEI